MTSRELTKATLEFKNKSSRVPVDRWLLPWAREHYPEELDAIIKDYPTDIDYCPEFYKNPPVTVGDPHAIGTYIDAWGCVFKNVTRGIVGEVKDPIMPADDEDWEDTSRIHIPEEFLTIDIDAVNRFCRESDKFVLTPCCPRPFEQLQFIRGTEQLYVDLMLRPQGLMDFIRRMHDFYCRELTVWAKTDVDALRFMDDWGSQNSLLINPTLWREIFKPMYRDYVNIAHSHGKKIFVHSDGNILSILPDLIEIGVDAINCQVFLIGIENLTQFKGKITFWGEVDRQELLPRGTVDEVLSAVAEMKAKLWDNGGCIAHCEFGIGARPENVRAVYAAWETGSNK